MKLGFYAECKEENHGMVCLEDPALSDRTWQIGSVVIVVSARESYEHFFKGTEPNLIISGNRDYPWMAASTVKCGAAEFEQALKEAKDYAAAMHFAIKWHIQRLAREEAR